MWEAPTSFPMSREPKCPLYLLKSCQLHRDPLSTGGLRKQHGTTSCTLPPVPPTLVYGLQSVKFCLGLLSRRCQCMIFGSRSMNRHSRYAKWCNSCVSRLHTSFQPDGAACIRLHFSPRVRQYLVDLNQFHTVRKAALYFSKCLNWCRKPVAPHDWPTT